MYNIVSEADLRDAMQKTSEYISRPSGTRSKSHTAPIRGCYRRSRLGFGQFSDRDTKGASETARLPLIFVGCGGSQRRMLHGPRIVPHRPEI